MMPIVKWGKFDQELELSNRKLGSIMLKNCSEGIGSNWRVVHLIRIKLRRKKIMNKDNYQKLNLVTVAIILENMLLPDNSQRSKILKCFEKIIKKEFKFTLKDLQNQYKLILKVEPNLIRNLKNLHYFRY